MKKKSGFTLAETLIVIAIIGIIASIVTPMLFGTTSDAALKVAWKKAYADLSQATQLMFLDNDGGLPANCTDWDANCFPSIYKIYFNSIKECPGEQTRNNCWTATRGYRLDNGLEVARSTPFEDMFSRYCPGAILNNGMFIIMETWHPDMANAKARMFIDINGKKGPNTYGKDLYVVILTSRGLLPFYSIYPSHHAGSGIEKTAEYLYR
ncbi:MAG: prepilin-type N-terminal cleavage/methylation domain-containing protein [Candidatus Gastranaerophilales bacterium]|nr:prepilin-type N-terminal cleavage/methylation domain-containing protein [Candidatus Gastranaerophilales bacterium]